MICWRYTICSAFIGQLLCNLSVYFPETDAESVDFNNPSQDDISCHGVQAEIVTEFTVLDGGKSHKQDSHDNSDGSERADTSNNALPLSLSRQQKDNSFEVSQALSTGSTNDEVQAPDQTEMHRDSSSEVVQMQTAYQDWSSIRWKDLASPEKPWLMLTNGQSKIMVSALEEVSTPETANCQEPAPPLLSVLEQHPLSSSHQDHLQEEQTELPGGGRETLAWLEEAAMNAVQSSLPAAATSFDDEILPASAPVENILSDAMAYSSMFKTDSTNEDWKSKSTHPIEELACRRCFQGTTLNRVRRFPIEMALLTSYGH
ncbi:unnamed protein product [Sphagnum troendelagicum]